MIIDRQISIQLAPREDGGLRAWSDDLPGLVLSHSDQALMLADLGNAIIALRRAQIALDGVSNASPVDRGRGHCIHTVSLNEHCPECQKWYQAKGL